MTDDEIIDLSVKARKFKFPPNDLDFRRDSMAGELGRFMRSKTYEQQKAYYAFDESTFFYIDSFEQYIRLKPYLGFKSCILYDASKTKGNAWDKQCATYYSKTKGNRFHLMHGRKLIHGFKDEYCKWYLAQTNAPSEFLLLNLHLNGLTNIHVNKCGTYHFLERETFDKCKTKGHSLETQVYRMLWTRLIVEKLAKADKTNFTKFLETCEVDLAYARHVTKKFRKYIIDKIKDSNNLSILDSHILKALIYDLGYNYIRLANETPRTFTHEGTVRLFPFISTKQQARLKQIKQNELNFIESETEHTDTDAFQDIWDDFWQEN